MPDPRKIEKIVLPKDPGKRLEFGRFMLSLRTMRDTLGHGSYARMLKLADPEWAKRALTGTGRNREAQANLAVMDLVVRKAVRLGGRLRYRRKKRGKR